MIREFCSEEEVQHNQHFKNIYELKGHLECLAKDEVDDPEDIMTELACESQRYIESLKYLLSLVYEY